MKGGLSMRKIALILLVFLAASTALLQAQTTGKLAGRVRDAQGRALEFVNITVLSGEQRLTGGQTRENGSYIILNIPPGTYTVRFQLVGYQEVIVRDVRINVNSTTPLDARMTRVGVEIEAQVVTAERDVQRDRLGSERQIDVSNITDTSVTDVAGILVLQPGITQVGGQIHIRGGRSNEINYTVDGMSVSDPVDGGSALQVDIDAIKDMKVMTGGFSAEYGNAQSAVINIVTKDGDPFYSGRIEYNTDHLFNQGRNDDVFKFAIGGPVLGQGFGDLRERFTFYLNGGGQWLDGRLRNYYVGSPNDDYVYFDEIMGEYRQLLEYEYPKYDPYANRKNFLGIDLGNRNYNSYNMNFKTKYIFNPTQVATFAIRGDRSYNHPFSYGWTYALQHYAFDETKQSQAVATYDHVFNPVMNLKVKASFYRKDSRMGPRGIGRDDYLRMYVDPNNLNLQQYIAKALNGDFGYRSIDDDGDGIYDDGFLHRSFWTYRIQGVEFPREVQGFNPPGTIWDNFIDDKTVALSARGDFEWQINDIHFAKTGLEIVKYDIQKNQLQSFLSVYEDRRQAYLRGIYNPANYDTAVGGIPSELLAVVVTDDNVVIPIYRPEDYLAAAKAASGKRDGYIANPWQAAYYLQDKMEWEGMIVNAGLRFDLWYLGNSYQVAQDDGSFKTVEFNKKDRFQMMISPRLGVSHPITDRDVLRFAYNYQNQLPQMQYIFTSKTPEDANISDQAITVGNPALEPQITVTYEVGLAHQLSEDYVLDVAAYYKNIYNYVSTRKVKKPGEEQITWYEFISEDYGSARGIDLSLEKLMSDFYNWSVSYSLAWAQGNNSSTVIQDEMTSLREFPLDWDIRHKLSLNYTFRIGRGEEYFIPFSDLILPFDDFTANMNWTFSSGAPYTPMSEEGREMLETNSKRMDLTHSANLRLSKGFQLSRKMNMRVFLDVENLFKTKNILTVYPRTGSPYYDGADLAESDTGFVYGEREFVHNLAIRNPGFVNNHRGITLGVTVNF